MANESRAASVGAADRPALPAARVAVGVAGYVGLFAALLFAPAGRLDWRAAWVLLAALLVMRAATALVVHRVNPALLAERTGAPIRRGQPLADRVLVSGFMASFAALVAFCSADVWRLRLLPPPPFGVRVAGLALF